MGGIPPPVQPGIVRLIRKLTFVYPVPRARYLNLCTLAKFGDLLHSLDQILGHLPIN